MVGLNLVVRKELLVAVGLKMVGLGAAGLKVAGLWAVGLTTCKADFIKSRQIRDIIKDLRLIYD